ncbi:MAG: diphosphomevalonate decarboxylase [Myxococcales bacterium]|nr:diphosphomevalonate decarboxylase [Myxococcota bacterium]MDW8282404.1 diphosphomevalonate decarboxylase [Myxococcales bacterium]
MRALAEARTNIALVKYWGKCDPQWNLPAVPSLSLTLDGLTTRTEVWLDRQWTADSLIVNDVALHGAPLERASRHLDRVLGPTRPRARVTSWNSFPTASGLASSASAFAALTVAAAAAGGLHLDAERLSILARQGSGSAARSILGGIVVLGVGTPGQPDSARATQLCAPEDWPALRLVLGIVSEEPKDTPSTDGMNHTAMTSPYYGPWLAAAPGDLRQAVEAVKKRDLEALGTVAERSALRMHASALAADPAVVYLRGATVEGLHAIRALRAAGVPAWFTCDAGPHPKALTDARYVAQVAAALARVDGVRRTLSAAPGAGARLLEEAP